ncbi:hypothetical protein [Histidinibacterium lentulum]|uniref:Uncharacterized protein n=1 Tax=Histidinibacterium lentulum TaxID=2480588 RepID=A0A3N2R959_9RHOB|nr:hypothetical protein [Histidinibacterium lentulum]ROU03975.1 hypothetical protein EAT49_00805 [Histidinibacterium lentulum]
MKLPAVLALALIVGLDLRAEEGCTALPSGVAFCGAAAGLAPDAIEQTPDGTALLAALGPYGLRVEVAVLSASATTDPWFVRRELDAFLAAERGLTEGLPELARDRVALTDRAAEQVVYALGDGDEAVTVADTVVLGDGFAVYVLTYDTGAAFTADHARTHDAALAALRLPPPRDPDLWTVPSDRPDPRPLNPMPPGG